MPESPLLTPLEMEFIQHLNASHTPSADTEQGLQVDAARQTTDLLASCAAREQLTIVARIDNQHLAFTPHLVTDGEDAPHLELGVPQIFEDGSFNRSWRLPLDPPQPLLSRDGQPGSLLIHELSMSGLLVEQTADSEPPERFSLDLQLDEPSPLTLQGSLVRVTEEGLQAYELTLDDENSDRLQNYLYRQHRSLFPEAHRG